jgi:hypothetical protein
MKDMGLWDRVRFKFWDPAGLVKSLIREWRPIRCKSEKYYENSLYSFLHKRLEDIQITKQYARGRIRADLVVGDKVIIELKNNLNTTAKYQKLIGQMTQYKEWDGQIVILLTGSTDANLRKELARYAANEQDDLEDEKIIIIEK